MGMRKSLCAGVLSVVLIFTGSMAAVSAHPGRTDSNGGHTCRTNCEKWGLEYGEYHYHNGGGSTKSKSNSSSKKSKTKSTMKSKTTTTQNKSKPSAPAYKKSGLIVYVNGNELAFDSDPLIYENTNLLPLREIAEGMGATVTWSKETGTILLERAEWTMTLTLGSKTVYYNGKAETASAAPKVINGITYVPAQVFVRGLGAGVVYNEITNSLEITYE